jgi:hypothetical protein
VYFVNKQRFAALFFKLVCQIKQRMRGKVKIVCHNIKRLLNRQFRFDVLQNQRSFAHAARSCQANHSRFPINFIKVIPVKISIYFAQ